MGCPGPSPRLLPTARIGARLPELFAIGQAAGGGVGGTMEVTHPYGFLADRRQTRIHRLPQ